MNFHRAQRVLFSGLSAVLFVLTSGLQAQKPRPPTEPWRLTSLLEDAGLEGGYVFQVDFETSGVVWIASASGLRRYDGYSWQHFGVPEGLPSEFVRAVCVDESAGRLWVGTEEGIVWLSLDSLKVQKRILEGPAGLNVRRIRHGEAGSIWICSDTWGGPRNSASGLARFDSNGVWTRYGVEDGLASNYIMDFFRCDDGREFVSTNRGLCRRDGERWSLVLSGAKDPASLQARTVWGLIEIPHLGLIASSEEGIFLEWGDRWEWLGWVSPGNPQALVTRDGWLIVPRLKTEGLIQATGTSVFGDDGVRMGAEFRALGSHGEVLESDGVSHAVVHPRSGRLLRLEEMAEAPDGSIWLIGRNLVTRWERSGEWLTYDLDAPVQVEDSEGNVWQNGHSGFRRVAARLAGRGPVRWQLEIGDPAKGFVLKSPDGGTTIALPKRLAHQEEPRIYQVPGAEIYAYGHGGLFQWLPDEERWDALVDNPDVEVYGVVSRGYDLWYATANVRTTQWRLVRVAAGRKVEFSVVAEKFLLSMAGGELAYSTRTGVCLIAPHTDSPNLISVPGVRSARAVVRSKGGELWVRTRDALLRFESDSIPPETWCKGPDSVEEGESISIELGAIGRFDPRDGGRRFAVQTSLDGGPRTLFETLSGRLDLVGDLALGSHRLEVWARDEGGDLDQTPAVHEFEVRPPSIWLLGWFRWGGVAVLALLVAGSWLSFRERRRLVGHAKDLSEQVSAESRWSRLNVERYRRLFEQSHDAVLLCDEEGRLIDANAAAVALLKCSSEDLPAVLVRELAVDQAQFAKIWTEVGLQGGVREAECRLRTLDGTVIDVQLSAVKDRGVEGNQEFDVFQVLIRDVSLEREMEERLRHSQKMEGIGQLAGGVAHDFNNLLYGIMGYADLLRDSLSSGESSKDRLEYVEQILETSLRAEELTAQLLAFSRRNQLRSESVDVHAVVNEVIGLLRRTIDPRIVIETDLLAPQCSIKGDPTQLHSMLLNLGINARDAMPDGGRLTFSSCILESGDGRIGVSSEEGAAGPVLEVMVQDTGCGISPEVKERIFEPFFTTKGVGQGTGLGLAAVYGTVLAHGGAIDVESDVGKGTAMRIRLPLDESHRSDEEVRESICVDGNGEHILLVDDDDVVRRLGELVLTKAGYAVTTACDGRDAVSQFRAAPDRFHLVVLDMMMPRLSGRDAMAELLAQKPDLRILIASGYIDGVERKDLIEAGASDVMQKPFLKNELLERVAAILS